MLDPQVKALLERMAAAGRPPLYTLNAPVAREEYRNARKALAPDAPAIAASDDRSIPGPHGPIGIRCYRPAGTQSAELLPALVYFHGGGFVVGDLDTHDVVCRALGNAARCAVVAVDYRLSPKHKFPCAVDDCVAATRWIAAHAAELRIDAARLAVGGDSAGANLATVTALTLRDAGGPKLAFQLLIYPTVLAPHQTRSADALADGYALTRKVIEYFDGSYIRGPEDYRDWRFSPLLATDLSRLPATFVLTAGYDPLLDDGKMYADQLRAAGVPVAYTCYEGMIHGFITMGRVLDATARAIQECAAALAAAFKR